MISADPADGKMRLILGDMMATFTMHGTPVAQAAINATIDLKIIAANNGYGVALELGKPDIHVNVLDDIENMTLPDRRGPRRFDRGRASTRRSAHISASCS